MNLHPRIWHTYTHTDATQMINGDSSDLSSFSLLYLLHFSILVLIQLLHMSNAHNNFCEHCVNRKWYFFLLVIIIFSVLHMCPEHIYSVFFKAMIFFALETRKHITINIHINCVKPSIQPICLNRKQSRHYYTTNSMTVIVFNQIYWHWCLPFQCIHFVKFLSNVDNTGNGQWTMDIQIYRHSLWWQIRMYVCRWRE